MVCIVGEALSGKTILRNRMCEDFGYSPLVTVTTREPRDEEVDGRDYSFYSVDQFKEAENSGKLMEIVNYGGNYYGMILIPPEILIEQSCVAVLTIEGVEFMIRYLGRENVTVVKLYKPELRPLRVVPDNIEERREHDSKIGSYDYDFVFYNYCTTEDILDILNYDLDE